MTPAVEACPVKPGVFEARGARLGQFILVLVIIATLSSHGPLRATLLTLLLVDLGCKAFVTFRLAPLSLLARGLVTLVRGSNALTKRLNVGPKRFAARVGFTFALVMALALLSASETALRCTGVMFGLAALLDATTGLCIACILYSKIHTR